MLSLNRIMVALDLEKGVLTSSSGKALEVALRVAQEHQSEIILVHALEVSEKAKRQILEERESPYLTHYQQTKALLDKMTGEATAAGVSSESRLVFGKPGLALIKEVLKVSPQLLLAGDAEKGQVAEALFGSTTIKLLKQCPCPLWITNVEEGEKISSVLVAHCLTEIGSAALRWGAATANLYGARLHVLHSLELEGYKDFLASLPAEEVEQARKSAKERIEGELQQLDLKQAAEISITQGSPHASIFKYIEEHSIRLLVMGTIARTGLAGVFTGNTAESLLPWVGCSLIALKPKDFVSPVSLD